MNTDESAWSRRGAEPIVGHVDAILPIRQRAGTETDIRGESVTRTTHDVMSVILSGPALALAAFAFAFAQLLGGLVPGELASMIPGAADSPTNHVRIVSLFAIGMCGVGLALAAAAFVRLRSARVDGSHVSGTTANWAGWLAGAAVVICAIVSVQSLLVIILSALAPPGATG